MSKSDRSSKNLQAVVQGLNIGHYQRHIFICTGDKCCSDKQGKESWDYLKKRMRELNLVDDSVFRTRVGCLRVCRDGPVGLVYPEGTWYKDLTPEHIEAVLQEHLLKGQPVEALTIARNPLPAPS